MPLLWTVTIKNTKVDFYQPYINILVMTTQTHQLSNKSSQST